MADPIIDESLRWLLGPSDFNEADTLAAERTYGAGGGFGGARQYRMRDSERLGRYAAALPYVQLRQQGNLQTQAENAAMNRLITEGQQAMERLQLSERGLTARLTQQEAADLRLQVLRGEQAWKQTMAQESGLNTRQKLSQRFQAEENLKQLNWEKDKLSKQFQHADASEQRQILARAAEIDKQIAANQGLAEMRELGDTTRTALSNSGALDRLRESNTFQRSRDIYQNEFAAGQNAYNQDRADARQAQGFNYNVALGEIANRYGVNDSNATIAGFNRIQSSPRSTPITSTNSLNTGYNPGAFTTYGTASPQFSTGGGAPSISQSGSGLVSSSQPQSSAGFYGSNPAWNSNAVLPNLSTTPGEFSYRGMATSSNPFSAQDEEDWYYFSGGG